MQKAYIQCEHKTFIAFLTSADNIQHILNWLCSAVLNGIVFFIHVIPIQQYVVTLLLQF